VKDSAGAIDELRDALLELHKSLLDAQRIRYERDHGRIESSGRFLDLVVQHPAFAWLRSLSALIAGIDEWVEAGGEARRQDLDAMFDALRSLIEAEGRSTAFGEPYWKILDDVPEALVAHVRLWRLLERARRVDPRRPAAPPRG
jgi:hypothetical protein